MKNGKKSLHKSSKTGYCALINPFFGFALRSNSHWIDFFQRRLYICFIWKLWLIL